MVSVLNRVSPHVLSVVRVVVALLFFTHGCQKILGWPAGSGQPAAFTMIWTAGMIELIGGALLAIGLFARPAAFVMSGLMAFAYWMAHAPRSPLPIENGGEAAVLFCFVFLYLVFAGPGPWSVDSALRRRA